MGAQVSCSRNCEKGDSLQMIRDEGTCRARPLDISDLPSGRQIQSGEKKKSTVLRLTPNYWSWSCCLYLVVAMPECPGSKTYLSLQTMSCLHKIFT